MTYEPVDVVEVWMWGRRLGATALDPRTGWYSFAYEPDWVAGGFEVAPLHMPLRTRPYEFADLNPDTYRRLPALLADSLPDRFGNAVIDAWMADNDVAPGSITAADRLAYIADRAMGALEFRPPIGPDVGAQPTSVALADLVTVSRQMITGELQSDATAKAALQQLIQVGTSAGGARAKAVVAYNPTTSQVRTSIGPLADGFEHWMIKLDGVTAVGLDGHGTDLGTAGPYGRIEYGYHLMAVAAGIDMAPCLLLAEGPRRHFMTKRFDREGDARRHVISLCALAHLDFNLTTTRRTSRSSVTRTGRGSCRRRSTSPTPTGRLASGTPATSCQSTAPSTTSASPTSARSATAMTSPATERSPVRSSPLSTSGPTSPLGPRSPTKS